MTKPTILAMFLKGYRVQNFQHTHTDTQNCTSTCAHMHAHWHIILYTHKCNICPPHLGIRRAQLCHGKDNATKLSPLQFYLWKSSIAEAIWATEPQTNRRYSERPWNSNYHPWCSKQQPTETRWCWGRKACANSATRSQHQEVFLHFFFPAPKVWSWSTCFPTNANSPQNTACTTSCLEYWRLFVCSTQLLAADKHCSCITTQSKGDYDLSRSKVSTRTHPTDHTWLLVTSGCSLFSSKAFLETIVLLIQDLWKVVKSQDTPTCVGVPECLDSWFRQLTRCVGVLPWLLAKTANTLCAFGRRVLWGTVKKPCQLKINLAFTPQLSTFLGQPSYTADYLLTLSQSTSYP